MSHLAVAREQIKSARAYTLRLLDQCDPSTWFRQPTEGVTHIAWQVGHLAIAQYRLALTQVRGERPEDARLIPPDFPARFGRNSQPDPDPTHYASPAELRAVLDGVHEQVLRELEGFAEEKLGEPPLRPHPLFNTKLGSLFCCAQHELVHAGQIGLLRRLLGQAPLR